MFEDFRRASEQLRSAWDCYLRACSGINEYNWQGKTYYDIPRGFIQQMDDDLSSHEENARRVRHVLKKARWHVARLVPINSLPSEILTRIFRLVLVEPCTYGLYLGYLSRRKPFSRSQSSDRIAQVCSRWRGIATAYPFLWTHVDIPLAQISSPRLLSYAKLHVQRTGNLPLEIHVFGNGSDDWQSGHDTFISFLEAIASRVGSLEFVIDDYCRKPVHFFILEAILSHCSPEIFNQLVTRSMSSPSPFIYSQLEDSDDDEDNLNEDLSLELPESQIEGSFSGLSTLNLSGCYPYWSSSAYRGLVELRLAPSPNTDVEIPTIHKSQLIDILTASPGLRIFYFGLKLLGPATIDTATLPIPLKDLEVVNLSTEAWEEWVRPYNIGDILRILGPGSKPLRLTINAPGDGDELLDSADELREFFERSKVEKLCLRRVDDFSEWMLVHTPDVKVLVLESCFFQEIAFLAHNPSNPDNSGGSTGFDKSNYEASLMLPLLHSCYICGGAIRDTTLRTLATLCPDGLILDSDSCEVYTGPEARIKSEDMPELFPTVKRLYLDRWDDLTADWDVLD
ncbi:hypothetical protein FRC11_013521 [Ceratobasidium sp. 423]|nr:hypothetical protein FRC11_013521 [Ceratobasidium sp. 423]